MQTPPMRRSYGLANDASANFAHERAVEEAILLIGLVGGVWPSDEMFVKKIVVQIIERTTTFAIHARRAAEIIDCRGIKIGESRWAQTNGPVLDRDFWKVANKILHARNIEVITFDHGAEMFTHMGDRVVTHLEIQSDHGPSLCFCAYGMAYGYLSQIAPATLS